MKPVPVPLFRLWLLVFVISGPAWGILWSAAMAALESKTTFLQIFLPVGALGGVAVGVGVATTAAWLSRPSRVAVQASYQSLAPLMAAAAARMKCSLEYLPTGEYVLRQSRSAFGVHPTLVVSPQSSTTFQIAGPSAGVEKLSEILVSGTPQDGRER